MVDCKDHEYAGSIEIAPESSAFEEYLLAALRGPLVVTVKNVQLHLDLTLEELSLVLASVSIFVAQESERLRDRPDAREHLLKTATAILRKTAGDTEEARDA